MNPAPVFDRVYAGLKQKLLSGAFVPGVRLDPVALADDLGASMTPLRDALYRLSAERIVDARANDGFVVPAVSEPDLRDLYAWSGELLGLALRHARAGQPLSTDPVDARDELPAVTARLFLRIAALSPNREHHHAVALANDRLHAVRRREVEVLECVAEELEALQGALARTDPGAVRRLLAAYHRRRVRAVPHIVQALYRARS